MKRKKNRKIATGLILGVLTLALLAGIILMQLNANAFAIQKPVYVYVDSSKDYDNLLSQLDTTAHIRNEGFFKMLAAWKHYPENMKTGKYRLTPGMSHLQAVTLLRSGQQAPVTVTFNNIRLKKDLAHRIGEQLEVPADSLLAQLDSPESTASYGFDTNTIAAMFIPNTYEIYWNITAERLMKRMKQEYDRFWTSARLAKAEAMGLSPIEVSILASIVEAETHTLKEYPIVAGLYYNRLKRGMPLQADPTVKFAVGDTGLRRILNVHLQVDSPYNTYRRIGLPPGPIRVPSIQGIDGVLNYASHNYLYMCAKEDFSGTHSFASTLSEHNRNAQKYRAALNRMNIR
jgi:UPF0755 protein